MNENSKKNNWFDDSLVYEATDSMAVRPCHVTRISNFPNDRQTPFRRVELKSAPLLLLAFIAQPHFEGNAAKWGRASQRLRGSYDAHWHRARPPWGRLSERERVSKHTEQDGRGAYQALTRPPNYLR